MTIKHETEILHPILGPMRLSTDDNTSESTGQSKWICRPDGWKEDFEIYLPDVNNQPQQLLLAEKIMEHRETILTQGRRVAGDTVYLGWIDLTMVPPEVAYPDDIEAYVIWKGQLTETFQVCNIQKDYW